VWCLEVVCGNFRMEAGESRVGTLVERYYRAKIQELKAELQLLHEFRHPKYLAAIQKLEADYKEELEFEETSEKLENERIMAEYEREQEAADKDLEERLTELMDTMIQECDEHKKHIEHEFHNLDINTASFSSYPVNKKSLRRRPNEPTPFSEKRMRAKNPQQVVYTLPESELLSDLRVLNGNADDIDHKTGYNLRGDT
uniref:Sin3 histone deacetylase corepressor complex component SDS3 n=1 Tax=Parascaris univalens TaxID=6257 RepID=A0A914ZL64_PARUN